MARELRDITDAEKVAAFDVLYAQARQHYDETKAAKRYRDDDSEHYLYEAAMEQTLGKGVFQELNAIMRMKGS